MMTVQQLRASIEYRHAHEMLLEAPIDEQTLLHLLAIAEAVGEWDDHWENGGENTCRCALCEASCAARIAGLFGEVEA